ncbi:phosphoribosylformylglycinamidine synthase subunit PurL [Spirochaeta cellobiosiphila]|uniref:phosphoribosylformylglycinamidine synthase subunit PurL n=1 Tax=Spirochaeta cellobiosiphila TaxID=504483 RepID=UPI00040FAF46|nr:AIR synthase-related protein [Spirochaeta cellobiosiphila]
MRVEIIYKKPGQDGRAKRTLNSLKKTVSSTIEDLIIADGFLIDNVPSLDENTAELIFSDPVAQDVFINNDVGDKLPPWNYVIEVTYKAGVADPTVITCKEAMETALSKKLENNAIIKTTRAFYFKGKIEKADLKKLISKLHNPLIQQAFTLTNKEWKEGKRLPLSYQTAVPESSVEVRSISITDIAEDSKLAELSKTRLLALEKDEMRAIQRHYQLDSTKELRKSKGLTIEPTDVELEMIAQTWSEHCKHKIFAADIEYKDQDSITNISSLYSTYIKDTTKTISKERTYLRSVFHDNAGVVQFDEDTLLCFKAETHNSPSALDPYGGAITGIVGVNRDILGTGKGAKPIFNTNVLCFGDPNIEEKEIPTGLLHPKQVMEGVHHGIIDGGNQSGIPTVGGAFAFDDSYIGKPLVFAGTGGILPAKINGEESWIKHIDKGDLVVMLGGRIGKDGIHGATFSSQALDEESPTSAVQIGDPITQKKMTDFLLEARDLNLYKGITDNGAGGLSSSLGEMAESSGGVLIELDKAPLKYNGLAPWEILVSESQERMSLSVDPEQLSSFLQLAQRRDVEATVIGEFTDSGYVELKYNNSLVGLLDMDFLHNGLPTMKLKAKWIEPKRENQKLDDNHGKKWLLRLLEDPTIASKENLVRQYDHEVQGNSVIKPFTGIKADGPSDGAVIRPKATSLKGVTVTHGICQRISDGDTYHMAMNAVDEAYRAHIALGGNPDEVSALDNFCWPDPIESEKTPDGQYKLAQLVRACQGLQKVCLDYKIPLISGKDSMKNDAILDNKKVSIRPTLLISLMGTINDVRKSVSTDFQKAGDLIYILGATSSDTGGSSLEKILDCELGKVPEVHTQKALSLYTTLHKIMEDNLIHSCHDLSDGGLGVALVESCIGGKIGAQIDISKIPVVSTNMEKTRILFTETPSRFLVSIAPSDKEKFEELLKDNTHALIGEVLNTTDIVFNTNEDEKWFSASMEESEKAWKSLH